ncbi:Galactokinase [Emticicia aquatica]|uniref:Galactokinase n=1 Tax=Emticicia aquatica TaxID=1681835 RepID=A0ABN8F0P4_9BACT|nr:galactokinase [Emticicia aquatica]CAH0997789.1 Galactokinase [Emticicia aquatica]
MELSLEEIKEKFTEKFHQSPQLIVRSPGRINLIGEHTDYNGGFVLPAAIDREIYFAISTRNDNYCHVYAQNLNEFEIFSIEKVERSRHNWSDYLKGVIQQIQNYGFKIAGFNLVFGGNIPFGAGVSSSAALETGLAFALNQLFDFQIPKMELVKLCQRAENEFVGLQCGIMDMFASTMGKENSVIRLDCRSLEYAYFPFLQDKYSIILCDTGVKHSLGNSEYNTRRQECELGVKILQKHYPKIQHLRDVSSKMLNSHAQEFDQITLKRCRYVVQEIERVIAACEDLQNNDLVAFGKKMYQTHQELRDDYEVSCEELDFLVAETQKFSPESTNLVLGSRMMGGGFGGCTINIVKKEQVDNFMSAIASAYQIQFNRKLICHKISIQEGTSIAFEKELV